MSDWAIEDENVKTWALGSQCTFPPEWRGKWYQSQLEDVQIHLHNITRIGHCVQKEDNKYLLFDRQNSCFRCLVFTPRHKNILQYKAAGTYHDIYHFNAHADERARMQFKLQLHQLLGRPY
ncbi:hypothetical protein LOTGIDRAFT_162569 [Lottia gigantea]|uniref:DUF7044 domain-containing protein n=1 Tax=Lottia gigantea TaxID=225164 RepID=V4BUC2_LOTGI|nr:hypothetical protein LOTGIDRAFT_162569 [Lottia gigantea]ESO92649.1 hypothetical protein LOTGIDRAFT_162569 [Lottia gigantea]